MRRFTHDCDNCQFVAAVGPYDIYICERSDQPTTYIARFGNNGWEYGSSADFPRTVPIETFRGTRTVKMTMREIVHSETSNLTSTQNAILTTFRLLPSLLLDMRQRSE